jgi:GNAT superfamily N-acetyltransferase
MPPDPCLTLLDGGYWDIDHAAGVCAAAAANTAVGRWLEPNPVLRGDVLFSRYRTMVRNTIRCGVVRLMMEDDRLVGVALWHSCPAVPGGPVAEPGAGEDVNTAGDSATRGRLLDRQAWSLHLSEPHEHLIYLGVVPDRQGRGIAGALLADRPHPDGLCAPRHTTSTGGGDLFARHGYRDSGPSLIVTGGGPRLWPMWQVGTVSLVRPILHERSLRGESPAAVPSLPDESAGRRSKTMRRQR